MGAEWDKNNVQFAAAAVCAHVAVRLAVRAFSVLCMGYQVL
jgi:hypothetical protein